MTLNKKVCVLVVDDDANARTSVALHLRQLGFEVATAIDGVDALHVLDGTDVDCEHKLHNDKSIDVIILDLRMPGMNGWQFLEHYNGAIPILVMSAWMDDDQPLAREPFAIIPKPADMREVAVMLRQAARSWGRL